MSATPPTIAVKPIIKGQTKEGGYALVTDGEWYGSSPITYTYQWQKCDQYGNSCQDISEAITNSYSLASADAGLTFRAWVTATNIAGTATSLSNLSASITSSSVASYDFDRNIVSDTGGQCAGCATENIASGDINSDGKQDVVVGGKSALLWYENNGSGTSWTPRPIASGWFGDGSQIVAEDINGDGRKDVVAGQDSTAEKVVWFENSGTNWLAHDMTTDIHCHDLVFADIDSDGQLDGACNDQHADKIVWLREPSDPTTLWETRVIDNVGAMGAKWADIDGDGRPDLVAGRSWYKNPGDLSSPWDRYSYTAKTSGYGFDNYEIISIIDLNQDGRLDIFATLFAESTGGKVWAFIAPDDPTTQSWAEVLVDSEPLFGVHSQVTVDFDGSGVPQIMVGESNYGGWNFGPNTDAQIYIYRLLGPATDPNSWQRTAIDAIGTHEAVAVDVNSDGRPDIVGHFENTDFMTPAQNGPVHWWKNNSN